MNGTQAAGRIAGGRNRDSGRAREGFSGSRLPVPHVNMTSPWLLLSLSVFITKAHILQLSFQLVSVPSPCSVAVTECPRSIAY